MNNDSDRPVYVILGATGGIGAGTARRLSGSGACLMLAARDRERLETLAKDLDDAQVFPLDATDPEEVNTAFETAIQEFGRIDGAANCVGSFMLKPVHMTSEKEFSQTLALNLMTAFGTVKAAAKHMPEGGSVVLLSSVAARIGLANHEAIAAAKAGVTVLALSAAASYAARGLRFNVVAPGLVQTPLTESVTRSATARQASLDLHPLGRLGEPEDIASAIAWLLDPAQGWMTGQVIGVDGGLSSVHPLPRRPAKTG